MASGQQAAEIKAKPVKFLAETEEVFPHPGQKISCYVCKWFGFIKKGEYPAVKSNLEVATVVCKVCRKVYKYHGEYKHSLIISLSKLRKFTISFSAIHFQVFIHLDLLARIIYYYFYVQYKVVLNSGRGGGGGRWNQIIALFMSCAVHLKKKFKIVACLPSLNEGHSMEVFFKPTPRC